MSIIISDTELATFVSGIRDHFQTFSQFHTITIIKEPTQTINNQGVNEYNGYGYQGNPTNYSATQQSGTWNCMTYTPESWEDKAFDPIPNFLLKGDLIIKLEREPSDYIDNGKNNLIIIDNETYNIVGGPLNKSYGTQQFYYYSLERTT